MAASGGTLYDSPPALLDTSRHIHDSGMGFDASAKIPKRNFETAICVLAQSTCSWALDCSFPLFLIRQLCCELRFWASLALIVLLKLQTTPIEVGCVHRHIVVVLLVAKMSLTPEQILDRTNPFCRLQRILISRSKKLKPTMSSPLGLPAIRERPAPEPSGPKSTRNFLNGSRYAAIHCFPLASFRTKSSDCIRFGTILTLKGLDLVILASYQMQPSGDSHLLHFAIESCS